MTKDSGQVRVAAVTVGRKSQNSPESCRFMGGDNKVCGGLSHI